MYGSCNKRIELFDKVIHFTNDGLESIKREATRDKRTLKSKRKDNGRR